MLNVHATRESTSMLEQRWHFESVVGLESSERTYQSDEHIALRVACFDDVRFYLKMMNFVLKTRQFVLKQGIVYQKQRILY